MNATLHAVVEVSAEEITLRVGSRWLRFTPSEMQESNGAPVSFALEENGTVRVEGGVEEEMDFAAERLVREKMFAE